MSQAPVFDLAHAFNQASFALAARMAAALGEHGLSIGEYCVLWKAGEGRRTQVEIAEEAAMDKSAVVKAVDGLERSGLAARRVHPSDRRARVVSLTESGETLLGLAHQAVNAVYADVLSDLDDDERELFLAGLHRVTSGVMAEPSHVSAMRRRATS